MQLNRLYSENQARNNNNFKQINPRLFDKNFTLNRNYNMAYPLTRSINLNYVANVEARIEEPYGKIDSREKQDSILSEFKGFGRTSRFYQSVNLTYTLPFSKIGWLKWINTSANYSGSFEWKQAPPAFTTLGNTIQNSQDLNITTQLNFAQLYSKIPWLRDYRKPKRVKEDPVGGADADDKDASALKRGKTTMQPPHPFKVLLGDFLTMFKNANVNINRKENTQLPGFAHRPDYFGYNFRHAEPGIGFVFGLQDPNMRYKMAESGALRNDTRQANFYQNNLTENISGNVTIEPLKDFRIRLSFLRNSTKGVQSLFKYDGTQWIDQGLTETGTFSISGLFLSTHFVKDIDQNENHPNPVFDNFLSNRYTVASRLQQQDPRFNGLLIDTATGFPVGYSKTSQDVILGGFFAAYSGGDIGRSELGIFPTLPMPNWNIDYNGLSKLPFLSDIFNNINIKHAYKGTYTVGNYQRNLKYDENEIPEMGSDLTPKYQIADVTITEGFFPFIGMNFTTKNNWTLGMEYKRNRVLKLFAASFNLTEMRQNEFTLNAGYRVTGMNLPIKRKGRRIYLPNDFRFDLAVSITDNTTIIRKIDVNVNRYTAGMMNIRITPSITYQINQKINLAFRYNRNIMDPKIATQFYTSLTDFGLELRYTFN